MPSSVTSPVAVTKTVAPHLTATILSTIFATPVDQLTVAQHGLLGDALARCPTLPKGSATKMSDVLK